MRRSNILPRLTLLLLLLLLSEVVALQLNRRPLQLVSKEMVMAKPGEASSSYLVCELINDRITPLSLLGGE